MAYLLFMCSTRDPFSFSLLANTTLYSSDVEFVSPYHFFFFVVLKPWGELQHSCRGGGSITMSGIEAEISPMGGVKWDYKCPARNISQSKFMSHLHPACGDNHSFLSSSGCKSGRRPWLIDTGLGHRLSLGKTACVTCRKPFCLANGLVRGLPQILLSFLLT